MAINKKTSDLSDEELILESIDNLDCFTELFERYQKKLLRYILRISTFSEDHAHEILQDSFLKVWKNINEFDKSMKFNSWIYRITHNETVSAWKREYRHIKKQNVGEFDIHTLPDKEQAIDILISEENNNTVKNILMQLPSKYRDIIVLRFWENKEYQEIAEILKKPVNTIGTLLHRAKKEFQKIISKRAFEGLENE